MSPGDPVPRTEPVRFGRYEVARKPDGSLDKLGAGAMGVTYRARDTLLQRLVVLKVVNADLLSGDGGAARKRFLREAAAAAQLVNPHVAAVHDIGVEADKDFYVMEFVPGRSLDEEVRNLGRLGVPEVLTIARHVALALAAAWQHQLVHRDIKPANLMLTQPPENSAAEHNIWVKVIDFGLAKSVKRTGTDEATASMVSVTGAFLGTPAFASPEQLEGRDLDTRTDLYSLGVTMFLALTGELPFTGTTLGQLITGHLAKPPPLGRLREIFVPEPVVGLIAKLLAKEPEGRPANGEVLLGLIDEIVEQITPPEEGVVPAKPSPNESPTIGDPVEQAPPPAPPPPAAILPQPPPPRVSPRVPPPAAILPQPPPPRVSPRLPPPAAILPQPPPPRVSPRLPPPAAVLPQPPPARVEPARYPQASAARDLPKLAESARSQPAPAPPARSFPLLPILGVAGLGLILILLAVLEPGGKPSRDPDPQPTAAPRSTPIPTPNGPRETPPPTPLPTSAPVNKGDAFGGALATREFITLSDAVIEAERLAPRDLSGAIGVLERAINNGDVAAASMLAAAYANGALGRPDRPAIRLPGGRNPQQAMRLARLAADRGDARACVTMGILYLNGLGVPRDTNRALELTKPNADRGEPLAALFVGLGYTGNDVASARLYLDRAAASGYTGARAALGAWLVGGSNITLEPARGLRLMEEAERDGSVSASYFLGLAYANGNGVPRNRERAIEYFRKASRAGYDSADAELLKLGEKP